MRIDTWTPFAPMFNKDEHTRALDEKETFENTLNEVIQTEVIDQRSEKSVQTEVISQRSEKSIQIEVRGCHKGQSCRSQNEDGEIDNQTEQRKESLLFTFLLLPFIF